MLEILYEDNHLLVAYKKRGMLSQADGSNAVDMLSSLKQYIKEKYQKPGNVYLGLVHRLDRNTAGVMVFARTSKAAARLSEQIRKHQFEKWYQAIVEGTLQGKGTLHHYLEKNEQERKSYVASTGEEAILEYQVIKNLEISTTPATLVEIHLKTGRFHQIRAQFSAIGHPLYGDRKYGSLQTVAPEEFPLEAFHLGFFHPITGKWLCFEKKLIKE